ncbi:MAG: transglycosylase SLT domain-containing protein [Prevotella sp.]|nr:transglycosylase SLT domain-containing protein [Prevotella sp.]
MKKYLIVAAILLGSHCATQAQTVDNDEITFTAEDGSQESIDVPEGMLVEIDSLLNLYNSRTYLNEQDCNFDNTNPEYSKETYVERLRRLPTVMEMPYNEVVRKFIDRYAVNLRRSVAYMLGASNFYMPIFEQALEANNLPLELRYLPVIESGLHPSVTSPAGASGLWQFMVESGKQYGLEINSLVDERRDPIKSSYAAAQLLKDLYKIYGDWNTVIAAYNCGPGTINKAMHRAGGSTDYWTIYKYLPKETQGYVPAFIAANYIMSYYCEHNICPMRTELPLKSDTIMVSRDVHFKQIAGVMGISVDELRTLNPQYRRDIVNGSSKPSVIRLPQQYVTQFIDNEDSIYAYDANRLITKRSEVAITQADTQPEAAPRQSYTQNRTGYTQSRTNYTASTRSYKRGETAQTRQSRQSSRSSRYSRTSRKQQQAAQQQAARQQRGKGRRGKAARQQSQSVTVEQGQTLTSLARKHGTTVDKLRKLNGIKGDNIRAGKKLRVK